MKKVLFLQIKNHINGGIRFVNKTLSDELVKLGYDVRICSIRGIDDISVRNANKNIKIDIINKNDPWEITHQRDIINSLKRFNGLRTFIRYVKEHKKLKDDYLNLKNYIKKYNPTYIIISHYQVIPGIPEEYLSRTINIHHSSYDFLNSCKDNKKKLYSLRNVMKFVWLTKSTCEQAKNDGFLNSTYIYNPIKFNTSKSANVVENKKLVCVARFGAEKRIPLMIDIANIVLKDNPDWSFELYGIDNEEQIIDKIKETDNNRIKFLGSVTDVESVLLSSSIYLCTSNFEGFSLSLLEAYECGIPVIAFDFGESCYEEIIDGKTGFIIEKDNVAEYVQKLNYMINNSNLLNDLSCGSKEFAKRFNSKTIIKEWIALFDEIETKQEVK